MSNRGGARPGAGRKRGSKNTVTFSAVREAKERFRSFLDLHEAEILERLRETKDDRVLFQLYQLLLNYADGRPMQHVHVSRGPTPEQMLEELAKMRAIDTEVVEPKLLEAGDPPADPAHAPLSSLIPGEGAAPLLSRLAPSQIQTTFRQGPKIEQGGPRSQAQEIEPVTATVAIPGQPCLSDPSPAGRKEHA